MRSVTVFAVANAVALAFGNPAHADPGITVAAIATGRLYVVGTTDQPHTSVSLDGKFTAESNDKGKFQFELVYYPAGCVVRATIGAQTYQAHVEQCGEKYEPERVATARPAPAKTGGSGKAPTAQRSVASEPPSRGSLPAGVMAAPQSPGQTGALPALPALVAHPIANPPLPPQRPTVLSAVKPAAPVNVVRPSVPAAKPKLELRPVPRQEPDEPTGQEQLDDPEGPDDLR